MNSRSTITTLFLAALLLPLSLGRAVPRAGTLLPEVVVFPFTIEPQLLPGAPADERAAFVQLLALEAASSAGRSLMRERLVVSIAQAPSQAAAAGRFSLTGTVRLPVSLPPGAAGLRADSRGGALAVAIVRLQGPDGRLLAQATAEVTWREADWVTGSRHFKRNRPVDDVLTDAVREATERAVKRLEGQRGLSDSQCDRRPSTDFQRRWAAAR
jgi:hypothetical protein